MEYISPYTVRDNVTKDKDTASKLTDALFAIPRVTGALHPYSLLHALAKRQSPLKSSTELMKPAQRGFVKGTTLGYVSPYEEEAKEFTGGEKALELGGDIAGIFAPYGVAMKGAKAAIKGTSALAKFGRGATAIGAISALEKVPEDESRVKHVGKNIVAYGILSAMLSAGGMAAKKALGIMKKKGITRAMLKDASKLKSPMGGVAPLSKAESEKRMADLLAERTKVTPSVPRPKATVLEGIVPLTKEQATAALEESQRRVLSRFTGAKKKFVEQVLQDPSFPKDVQSRKELIALAEKISDEEIAGLGIGTAEFAKKFPAMVLKHEKNKIKNIANIFKGSKKDIDGINEALDLAAVETAELGQSGKALGRALGAKKINILEFKKVRSTFQRIEALIKKEIRIAEKAANLGGLTSPKAGGKIFELPQVLKDKGVQVTKLGDMVKLTKNIKIKDASGKIIKLAKGQDYTGYTLSNGQTWFQGKTAFVLEDKGMKQLLDAGIPIRWAYDNINKWKMALNKLNKMKGKGVYKDIVPDWVDMLIEAETAIKLTSPITQIRNILGNTFALGIRPAEQATSGLIDYIHKAIKPDYVRQRFAGEALQTIKGYGKQLPRALKKAMRDVKGIGKEVITGKRQTSTMPSISRGAEAIPLQAMGEGAIGGGTGVRIRTPFKALEAMDDFFRSIGQRGNTMGLLYREAMTGDGTKAEKLAKIFDYSTLRKVAEKAHFTTLEYLYKKALPETGMLKAANTFRNKHRLAKLIVPFFQTPVNIIAFTLNRSPLGILAPSNIAGLKAGGGEAADAMSRIFVGSGIAGIFYGLSRKGLVQGDAPENKSEREAFYRQGKQPNSVKIGNKWVSFLGYEPISTQLTMAANMAKKPISEMTQEDYTRAIFSVTKNITQQPYLTGVRDLLNAVTQPERYGERWATRFISGSTIPTGVAWAARATDPIVRQADTLAQSLAARIPGLSRTVPARTDIFGKDIKRDMPMSALASTTTESKDIVEGELDRLSVFPGMPQQYVTEKRKKKDVPKDIYIKAIKQVGPVIKMNLERLITSPEYANMSDYDKETAIRRVLNKAGRERGKLIRALLARKGGN